MPLPDWSTLARFVAVDHRDDLALTGPWAGRPAGTIFDGMSMRVLVACPGCNRQFDAGSAAPGTKYRCTCGATVTVPRVRPHDAAVVRCSGCGAPRAAGSQACTYCQADFTLHERDMHTICAACMTRVSDRARYCPHCGKPIAPEGVAAGAPTDHACPACGRAAKLQSRSLGDPPLAMLECPRCVGLWLGQDSFRAVVDRTRRGGTAELPSSASAAPGPSASGGPGKTPVRKLYRPCPVCRGLMHRHNYGTKSGVIMDACREHGVWFDALELERILKWIRQGGESRAAALAEAEQRAARHRETGAPAPGHPPQVWHRQDSGWSEGGWLRDLAEFVVRLDWLRS